MTPSKSTTRSVTVDGPAGAIEALISEPSGEAGPIRGAAFVAHPHPLFGGTMDNKVVHTIARACVRRGWRAVRFNFRGVGASEGSYDEGRGETDDLLAVIGQLAGASEPLVIAGFSFGSRVAAGAVQALHPSRAIERVILVGTAASNFVVAPIAPELHPATLVVHGELDDTVPLSSVMDWARPQSLPVTVVPGGEHFFHGKLPILGALVERHLCQ